MIQVVSKQYCLEITRIENLDKNLIFDIDVVGALNIKSQFSSTTLSIFIMPPSLEILEESLRSRATENTDSLSKRLEKAKEEMKRSEEFDQIIVNKNLPLTIDQVCSIIKIFLQK